MNIIEYINNTYYNHLRNFSYIKQDDCENIKRNYYIKGINKSSLILDIYGCVIEANAVYIKVRNLKTHITSIIYPEHYYIFTKKYNTYKKKSFGDDIKIFIKKLDN